MIFVDDARRRMTHGPYAHFRWKHLKWSHLFAVPHNSEELYDFAREIGLKFKWVQNFGTNKEHYDVTETMREKALENGATEVTAREAVKIMRTQRYVSLSPAPQGAEE